MGSMKRQVLFWNFIIIICSLPDGGVSEDCRGGHRYQWGPDCEYQCRCKEGQEICGRTDGACTTPCQEGQFGPGCQYVNAAYKLNGVSNLIRLSEIRYAVDGDETRCARTDDTIRDPYITIYLQGISYVSELEIVFESYGNVTGFEVYVGKNNDLSDDTFCADDPGSATGNTVKLFCGKKMEANYLTILVPGESKRLGICELYVNGGRNLEYERPAYSSSVLEYNVRRYGPANAVNGESDPDTRTSIELPEEQVDPWWFVDLSGQRRITKVKLTMHWESERFKMKNVTFFACNKTDCSDKTLIYQDFSDPVPYDIEFGLPDAVMRSFGIQLLGAERQIFITRIQIYGGCPENRCGMDCLDFCYCKENVKTINEELYGHCPGDCDRNWQKIDNKCNTTMCEGGKFGPGCRYSCNCQDRCEPWSGHCISAQNVSLEACKKHWHGRFCQGYNAIAESQFTVEGNSTYQSAGVTVDGNITTCGAFLSGQGASWIVPLAALTYVDQVAVYVNGTTTGFGLEIMAENDNKAILCRASWFASQGLYIGFCGHVMSTHVRVRTRSTMQICEVAVLDCANGTFGDLCDSFCHCQGGAVCNKETGECPPGGCDTGFFGSSCSLACYDGYYGPDCAVRCGNCKNNQVCDRITGWCDGGCSLGFRGLRCDQECRDGTWGDDCALECGYCLDGGPCDKLTGLCPYGCAPGFSGSNCTLPCKTGEFGVDCAETCGSCRYGEPCGKTDGVCRNGCELGKQPPLCKTDCDKYTYGEGCYGNCGNCHYKQTCNPVNGVCDNGCEPGYYVESLNPKCTKECVDGYFGFNCTTRCEVDICKGSDVCNKTNGECLNGCKYPGYQAPECKTECSDGRYGFDCSSVCGRCINYDPCNKTNGVCLNGCAEGFTGELRLTSELSGQLSTSSIVLIVIGIIVLVLGLTAAIVAFLVSKRRRQGKALSEKKKPDNEDAARNASIISRVYENNNINTETELSNEKRHNTNNDVNYQLSQIKPKYTVAVEELWDYVLRGKCTKSDLKEQFDQLIKGLAHPCEAAKKSNNLHKNRYKEIFAYDHTRVKLHVANESDCDYINASFLSGYNRPHMYIAAQGPTEELVNDFWAMIWQQKCRKIVMLTKLIEQTKMRCAQYWPDEGEEMYGSVSVSLKAAESYADFDVRTFLLSVEGQESREVRHYHFTSWPDRQVPECASSVVHFWSKVRTTDSKDNVPILIHCSAGIGRSGSFIALDYLVDQASVDGYVNVFQCVQNLRHQRVNMVQTLAQYNFLHEALVEALLCPSNVVHCERFPHVYKKLLELEPKSRKPRLQCEFEKLQYITKFHDSMKQGFYDSNAYMTARKEENKEKNRCDTILPPDMHRPWLTTRVFERNDYINAVFLPSYREDRKYLLTQNPLPDTIVDFWRMVYENNVTSVVSLDTASSQSEVYWATAGETVTYIPFQIHHISENEHEDHIERTMKLLNAEEPKEKPRIVKLFECKFWQGEKKVPSDPGAVLTVIERVLKLQEVTASSPLVVHCLNGAQKSGLFCVIAGTMEQLSEEREVALAQTLKQMRIRRHQIVPFYEHYKFAHDVIIEFLKNFDTFSDIII